MPVLPQPFPIATGGPSGEEKDKQFLLQAFSTFSEAAGSLERSYRRLRGEVARLTGELEESNRGLARSLEENRCIPSLKVTGHALPSNWIPTWTRAFTRSRHFPLVRYPVTSGP
jgi:hypothetical protein